MTDERRTIRLFDKEERNCYHCPRGHVAWFPIKDEFHCTRCTLNGEDVTRFDELTDSDTGETIARDDVELLTAFGPYREVSSMSLGGDGVYGTHSTPSEQDE
ncbi:hypothetical protein [Halorubrum trueperi]|uniref:Uncharacterized protein n=1 Tax=Halorubrum trueperi TaxID=2004704 RepID=A0ABD5UI48_9EURY